MANSVSKVIAIGNNTNVVVSDVDEDSLFPFGNEEDLRFSWFWPGDEMGEVCSFDDLRKELNGIKCFIFVLEQGPVLEYSENEILSFMPKAFDDDKGWLKWLRFLPTLNEVSDE